MSHSLALDVGRRNKNKDIKENVRVCACVHLCVWAGGHPYPRVMWSDVWSWSPGLGLQCKTDEENISSLPSRLLCVCVQPCAAMCAYVWADVCVCVDVRVCACVLNLTGQVVRYHPNTVARQMADRATCIPFRPLGQTPSSPP